MISTHVLDTAIGRPAEGVGVSLFCLREGSWIQIGHDSTDNDGRIGRFDVEDAGVGVYKLVFDVD